MYEWHLNENEQTNRWGLGHNMVKKRKSTLEELEKLVIYGKRVATRMLALMALKTLYYSVEPARKLEDIQEILNR